VILQFVRAHADGNEKEGAAMTIPVGKEAIPKSGSMALRLEVHRHAQLTGRQGGDCMRHTILAMHVHLDRKDGGKELCSMEGNGSHRGTKDLLHI
jgi:hypothetical protein